MERAYKITRLTGMWLASLVGAVYGLVLTIIGAAVDWGPGGGMAGPYWSILVVGMISLLAGLLTGVFGVSILVRWLKVFQKPRSRGNISILMFLVCTAASLLAWVLSWEAGMISGILLGTITWDEVIRWGGLVLDTALMSIVLGIPFYLLAGIINALVTLQVTRKAS